MTFQPVFERACRLALTLVLATLTSSCGPDKQKNTGSTGTQIRALTLAGGIQPTVTTGTVSIAGAKNEAVSFTVRLDRLPQAKQTGELTLRLLPLKHADGIATLANQNIEFFQVLDMPVDTNQAGFVRHTGLSGEPRSLPRALLPIRGENATLDLFRLRDPAHPTDAKLGRSGIGAVDLWCDVRIPPETPAGQYGATCEVVRDKQVIASTNVELTVHDFVLPDERHLAMIGQIEWESLQRLYPDRFEAVTPRLMNRGSERHAQAVKTLDELMKLAVRNRAQLVVPRLQPVAKWPAGRKPEVSWEEYDSVVAPWLNGEMFPDKTPLGFWPLPRVDGLDNYDDKSQRDYWLEAASHFDQREWINRSPIVIDKTTPGRANTMEATNISSDAARLLDIHPRLKVMIPLEDDQVQFANPANDTLIKSDASARLITANPGVVFSSPARSWPEGVSRPPRWLRTDLTGLIPYAGAGGDERDVRLWAWLASVPLPPPQMGVQYGPVQVVRWASSLPRTSTPTEPADPDDLVWFYPGSWFGVDEPLATVQLKWLRRAQQDYEYLYLARQRGEITNSLLISRLMTKPVELQPNQTPDATFGLMSGATDAKAWNDALNLLAQRILLREPGQTPDTNRDSALGLEILRWAEPLERPVIMGRNTRWTIDDDAATGKTWINLSLGIDIYNASDSRPEQNTLQYTSAPAGWEIRPQPIEIPALATYRVQRFNLNARVDALEVRNVDPKPLEVTFTNGFTRKTQVLSLNIPVAATDRREGGLNINGSLEDWTSDDAVQNTPMVQMFNRPALQRQLAPRATSPAEVFTGWADDNFYVAFKVSGVRDDPRRATQNFVQYQFRRAWGEDSVSMLVQPVYRDSTVGPIIHMVCKPNAHWVERKDNERFLADPWQSFEGTGVRYAATQQDDIWRGEVAIPWKAIMNADRNLPVMLRFNFVQHKARTGESASWAGPVDFGRDDAFTGVLFLRETNRPGMTR